MGVRVPGALGSGRGGQLLEHSVLLWNSGQLLQAFFLHRLLSGMIQTLF